MNIFYLESLCAGKFLPVSLLSVKGSRRTQGRVAEKADANEVGCAGAGRAARVPDWRHGVVRQRTVASLAGNCGGRIGLSWI